MPETLTIRVLRFHTAVPGFRGQTIIVATTLLDPKVYPFEEIAGLYRDSWIVELRLRDIKTVLGMDIPRGKSADVVRTSGLFKAIVIHQDNPGWHDTVLPGVDADADMDIVNKVWNAEEPCLPRRFLAK